MECETCEGTGRIMNEERFKVSIPPGLVDGQTIRLRGKGAHGQNGNPPGDLLLSIYVERHPTYERDGFHLRLRVPLSIRVALEGTKIKVPTPDGAIRVTIPPNAQSGATMRIKGRGLPKNKTDRGDLYLVMQPQPPNTADAEAITLAKALDAFYNDDLRSDWD